MKLETTKQCKDFLVKNGITNKDIDESISTAFNDMIVYELKDDLYSWLKESGVDTHKTFNEMYPVDKTVELSADNPIHNIFIRKYNIGYVFESIVDDYITDSEVRDDLLSQIDDSMTLVPTIYLTNVSDDSPALELKFDVYDDKSLVFEYMFTIRFVLEDSIKLIRS